MSQVCRWNLLGAGRGSLLCRWMSKMDHPGRGSGSLPARLQRSMNHPLAGHQGAISMRTRLLVVLIFCITLGRSTWGWIALSPSHGMLNVSTPQACNSGIRRQKVWSGCSDKLWRGHCWDDLGPDAQHKNLRRKLPFQVATLPGPDISSARTFRHPGPEQVENIKYRFSYNFGISIKHTS